MKKLKKIGFATALTLSLFASSVSASAATHTVQSGDTFWNLGMKYGVSVLTLKEVNKRSSDLIYPGEKLEIPQSVSSEEKELLARLVHAEAKGEPYEGKVAVATVVLNRVDSDEFPDTIKEVIYEKTPGGAFAFSPVLDGQINQAADEESKRAVDEAITFRGQGKGSLFFFNPKKTSNEFMFSREVTTVIGNHRFAK
ncbi:cell wall hydrolase [Litchfieldia sinesaloumensis]|uniref:cell wall hydrolase n=1 Tax=Litchfieldia sinesaloumensis TaxID=1926280 RepID=UPI0009883008|nr:cell wall hydrolase [Bacillus sinesaloumensis]